MLGMSIVNELDRDPHVEKSATRALFSSYERASAMFNNVPELADINCFFKEYFITELCFEIQQYDLYDYYGVFEFKGLIEGAQSGYFDSFVPDETDVKMLLLNNGIFFCHKGVEFNSPHKAVF